MEAAGRIKEILELATEKLDTCCGYLESKERRHVQLIRHQIWHQKTLLENTYRVLLHDIVPDTVLDDFLQYPLGSAWGKYDSDIPRKLQQSYEDFHSCLIRMMVAASIIRTVLGIARGEKVTL